MSSSHTIVRVQWSLPDGTLAHHSFMASQEHCSPERMRDWLRPFLIRAADAIQEHGAVPCADLDLPIGEEEDE